MIFKYAVTFEHSSGAPVTVRGEVKASVASAAASRAFRQARSSAPRRRHYSIVLLLEPQFDASTETVDDILEEPDPATELP